MSALKIQYNAAVADDSIAREDDHEASLHFPSDTPQQYRVWFEEYSQFAYKSSTPYPWRRLGYIYDWNADNKRHIGPGEFVVSIDSLVRMKAKPTVCHDMSSLNMALRNATQMLCRASKPNN